MSYKLEQSIIPPPKTDTTVACDFEISETSSKLPAFFLRKTKCTPAEMGLMHKLQKLCSPQNSLYNNHTKDSLKLALCMEVIWGGGGGNKRRSSFYLFFLND